MRQLPNRFACAVGLAVLAWTCSVQAATVFSNFGPFNSFADNGLLLQGESVGTIANVDQAAAFTVGASNYVVTSVSLGIHVSSGPTIVGTGPLDIIIASNVGGLPGAELKTFSLNVNTTGKQIVTGAGGPDLQLSAGTTYWIIADAKGTFDGGWNFNSIGDLGPTAGRSGPTGNPIEGPWGSTIQGSALPSASKAARCPNRHLWVSWLWERSF